MEKKWINGNRMLFESDHKTFNKQVDCISTGNVLGHVQFSSFVRAYNTLECNGRINAKGHLQKWDFDNSIKNFPYYVKEWIRKHAINNNVIAYEFRHFRGSEKIIHGYVITDGKHKLLKTFYTAKTWKSYSVIDEAIKYITD